MGTPTLFPSLFEYKAQANRDLYAAVGALEASGNQEALHAALRILNHVYVVDRIFRAHLTGEAHEFTATNTAETPALLALRDVVKQTDAWYVDYTRKVGAGELGQEVGFVFTDGKQARMSRQEMLAHVVTHGAYHRGAVGRILDQHSATRPPDGFTNFLHSTEPDRRVP